MSIRKKYIVIILFLTTLEWALWTGGQFFNALMVVPGWSYDVPRSVQLYQQNMLSHIVAYFFLVVNPVFLIVPAIAAWIMSLKIRSSFRKWFGIAVLLDVLITLTVGLWMAPAARSIFDAAEHGGMDLNTMLRTLHVWKTANTCRVVLEIITLFFFLVSILKFNEPARDNNSFNEASFHRV
jgi:hypothetical protein